MTKMEHQVMMWLNGSAPDLDGVWFGDCECCDHKRPYWWRRHLRKMLDRCKK